VFTVYTTSCNIKNLLILLTECVYVCHKFFPYVNRSFFPVQYLPTGHSNWGSLCSLRRTDWLLIHNIQNFYRLIQKDNCLCGMKLSWRFWVEHDAVFICIFCGIFGAVCLLHIQGIRVPWNGEEELFQALVTNCKILGVIIQNTNRRFIITWTVWLVLAT